MSPEKQRRTFLSYSRVNKDFALKLAKELKADGFLVWLDQLDIPTGARWDDELERALEKSEIFMVILTPSSTASDNVKDEIGYAIDTGKRILPILLKDAKVPLRLRRFQYVDFTTKSFEEGIASAKQLLKKLIEEPTIPREQSPGAAQVQKSEADGKAKEEAERIAKQKAESERLASEKMEAARLAAQKVEANRKAKEETERVAKLQAEKEKLAEEKQALEKIRMQTAAQAPEPNPVAIKTETVSAPPKKKKISKPLMIGMGVGVSLILVVCAVLGVGMFLRPTDPPISDPPVVGDPPVDDPPVVADPPTAVIPNTGDDPACPFDSSEYVDVYVENDSNLTLDYYWINYDCETEYYGSLGPGEATTLGTYVSHVWEFYDNQTGDYYFGYETDGGDYLVIPGNDSTPEVTGYTVYYVSYDGGEFVQTGELEWTETSYIDGADYYFEEFDRDEWSVYLYDNSRDVSIQLDLWTGQINVWDYSDESWYFLFSIEGAQ